LSLAAATDKLCRVCGGLFHPRTSMASICSPVCATKYAKGLDKDRKVKAKAERAQTKARKEKIKTIAQIEEECRKIVQKIARLRDRNQGCISCDKPATWDGQWHGIAIDTAPGVQWTIGSDWLRDLDLTKSTR
jgi:hypothetical protein